MTAEEAVLTVLKGNEGGFRAQVTRPDGSIDPDTNHGITAITLGIWRKLGRWATTEEVRDLQWDEAAQIYLHKYIIEPGFLPTALPFEPLRIQVVDFGVNSGPDLAIRWLQRVIRMPKTQISGDMDWNTIRCILDWHDRSALPLVNDALVAARCYMVDRCVDQGIMRKADEEGVESRALGFFLAKP